MQVTVNMDFSTLSMPEDPYAIFNAGQIIEICFLPPLVKAIL